MQSWTSIVSLASVEGKSSIIFNDEGMAGLRVCLDGAQDGGAFAAFRGAFARRRELLEYYSH